jgi:hypothetical protein
MVLISAFYHGRVPRRAAWQLLSGLIAELKISGPLLASHRFCKDRKAAAALSRPIVTLVSPDTLGFLRKPGSAATAGCPHRPSMGNSKPSGIKQWQDVIRSLSMAEAFWRSTASYCWMLL